MASLFGTYIYIYIILKSIFFSSNFIVLCAMTMKLNETLCKWSDFILMYMDEIDESKDVYNFALSLAI